jgi:16S rRNA processing protein RimM
MAEADRLCLLGVVGAPRGLKGEVRVESYTADPADIAAYGPLVDEKGERPIRLKVTGRGSNRQVLARIDGVTDRDGAEAMKGRRLYVSRSAFPAPAADEFYSADLIGLKVERVGGEALGTVKAVEDYGGGPFLEIEGGVLSPLLVPMTEGVVTEVDLAGGRVVIDPPPGLLEGPSKDGEGRG